MAAPVASTLVSTLGRVLRTRRKERRMKRIGNRRKPEAGFAMLLVFLMAAVVAMMLYVEIPRVAFDAQRQKEQLLIMRGEQYKRAIQMFMKENKRWPSKIEELESLDRKCTRQNS